MKASQSSRDISIQKLINKRRITDIRFGGQDDAVYWSEVVDAKGLIFCKDYKPSNHPFSEDLDIQGSIGYGGGEFDLNDKKLVMVDRLGKIVFQDLESHAGQGCLKPGWNHLASPSISSGGNHVLFVASDGETDCIALAELSDSELSFPVIQGSDFYMSPTWHPEERMVAWVEWSHPYMPWDASCIKIGNISLKSHLLTGEKRIAGSIGNSASQPQFSPCGRWLSYILRNGEWDDLMIYDLESGNSRILIKGDGFHLKLPDWVQGMHSYGWEQTGEHIYHLRYSHGQSQLWRFSLKNSKSVYIDTSPFKWITQLSVSLKTGRVAFIGSSPSHPRQIAILSHEPNFHFIDPPYAIENAPIPDCKEIQYMCPQGYPVFGWLYEPANPLPDAPLIIHIHGGPTSVEPLSFSPDTLFFTSRGYNVVEVNYRGSSTYGYQYQDALRHAWGAVDVEDVVGLLDELIKNEKINPERIALMGSSAGGFTVLNCLIQYPDRFNAAVCSYAVSDLIADARNTHKFERYYHSFLTGELKENADRFIERSPINHIDKINNPLLLFHGGRDPIVDPAQSRMMFQKLLANGIPCELVIYPDEGHGFRRNVNVVDYYQTVDDFLRTFL